MNRNDNDNAIEQFLSNGGEITLLSYADKKSVQKAQRLHHHRSKACEGNESSKRFLEQESARESTMIFSRVERNREE